MKPNLVNSLGLIPKTYAFGLVFLCACAKPYYFVSEHIFSPSIGFAHIAKRQPVLGALGLKCRLEVSLAINMMPIPNIVKCTYRLTLLLVLTPIFGKYKKI